MQYIMVTDFDNHWDHIEKNFTSYSSNMVKPKMIKERIVSGTLTIFIKKTKFGSDVEKTWIGKVWDIANLSGKIFFRIELEKEITCPEEYKSLDNGWYIEY
ncbi:MAG: hypothetical protein JW913_12455 [Chitinispirillaceae bacterium]|nr:hypothetical protein [Chitinispirillaceae bacterium]